MNNQNQVLKQLTLPEMFWKDKPTFHLRLTSDELVLNKTYDSFVDVCSHMIICQEGGEGTGKAVHQHILMSNEGLTRKIIKEQLKTTYPRVRGNKMFSITEARSQDQLAKYVCKEGSFLQKGFTNKQMDRFKKLSYSVDTFKKKFQCLKESLLLKEISLSSYTSELIKLKGDAEQPIYLNHITAHVVSMGVKTGEIEIDRLTDTIMSRVFDTR